MIIELPILGFLKEEPMHGYELRQRLQTVLGFAWQPSFGALYPMLQKLEQRGFVTKAGVKKGPGPQKQVYSITDRGEDRLRELLLSKPVPVGLPLQILFLDQLSKQERIGLLQQARQQRVEALDRLERERDRRTWSMNRYQRIVLDYGLETIQREIAWLEELEQN